MKILLTGGYGFLGWHTRARLHALGAHEAFAVGRNQWDELPRLAVGVDAVLHLAGINRGNDREVEQGNVELARDVVGAVRAAGATPRIVFANSVQSGNDSPYGAGKEQASSVLADLADEVGSGYVDVRLPNLFGEHGRPRYNSFVATFVESVLRGETPRVNDREVDLLHAQGAAQSLMQALTTDLPRLDPRGTPTTVEGVYGTLRRFNELYTAGDIPPLLTTLDVNLFNTLRGGRFPERNPIGLSPRTDDRGSLVEVVRAHGGQGQTFVSTTRPGITRGQHFHLHKVERFVVLSGNARISLRRLFTDDVVSFDVTGDVPQAVDMPTLWVHNITNTGDTELVTLFWTHELFNPAAPDTYPEPVAPVEGGS
ncbi:NAD-dependent epimerase/dehydratase family protein [Aeromicrobium sp.]|uniref:polysaccharide biosynthesis C-terminal domain-containing protein n=1 Tax=Aeromicrobium sp. TaxID=1871063 RepID=UPI0019BB65A0|nr:NAD-dependent epimerase/dehydratase family protein [Aeromicrobium sp.]MBC7632936.1 SDR family oxidoreductase [Aeromicrobium sp.]